MVIDGGKTQLKFVQNIIKNSSFKDIKVISIVKGLNRVRATETIISSDGIVEMDKSSKAYIFLQEIRNEAHRFAINAQRRKKNNITKESFLDDVDGIGPVIKNRLFKKFKNAEKIKNANVKDLMTIRGINEKIAKKIILN